MECWNVEDPVFSGDGRMGLIGPSFISHYSIIPTLQYSLPAAGRHVDGKKQNAIRITVNSKSYTNSRRLLYQRCTQ